MRVRFAFLCNNNTITYDVVAHRWSEEIYSGSFFTPEDSDEVRLGVGLGSKVAARPAAVVADTYLLKCFPQTLLS
jgi:hypothetical protein